MTARTVTAAQLRAYVDKAKSDQASVIGFRAAPVWGDNGSLGEDVLVMACASTLAARAAVWDHLEANDGRLLVILTDVDDIGSEVLARLYRRELLRPESYEILKDLFRVVEVARPLQDHQWLADALVDVAPVGRTFAPPPGGVLDLETAWQAFLLHGLRLQSGQPTLRDLLAWSGAPVAAATLAEFSDDAIDAMRVQLDARLGSAAGWFIHLVRNGASGDVVPLGLVAAAATASGVEAEHATIARTHLGLRTGGGQPDVEALQEWGEASTALVRSVANEADQSAFGQWTSSATQLLTMFGIPSMVRYSTVIPAGFDAQLDVVGQAARVLIAEPSSDALAGMETSVKQVTDHVEADRLVDRVRVAKMVHKLCRRLLDPPLLEPATDLADAASTYIGDGAWVDEARQILAEGDPVPSLGAAAHALVSRLSADRRVEDQAFAERLATWSAIAPSSAGALIPIETVLDRVAVPAVRSGTPVLLLLLDGLSWAQGHRMFDDIARRRFRRVAPDGHWGPVVSTLPSVTQCSRSSLFAGKPVSGGQDVESEGFAHHPGLLEATNGAAPVLFHKKALIAHDGQPAPEVRTALTDAGIPVVGVVVNGADDHLGSGGQLRLADGLRGIAPLNQLLDWAMEADRAVIVVADHGHIRELGSTVRPWPGGGERWRPVEGQLAEDEVVIEGPRVLRGDGRIIAPATEAVRYNATKKVGYHGGATPQEVLCPLAVFVPGAVEIDGWLPELPQAPTWWDDGVQTPSVHVAPSAVPTPTDHNGIPTLFGTDNQVATPSASTLPSQGPAWIDELVRSPMFEQQSKASGRKTLDRDSVVSLLTALHNAGGTLTGDAFALAVRSSPTRARGKATALAGLLNVDGFAAVTVDSTGEVTLNAAVLAQQFAVDIPAMSGDS